MDITFNKLAAVEPCQKMSYYYLLSHPPCSGVPLYFDFLLLSFIIFIHYAYFA